MEPFPSHAKAKAMQIMEEVLALRGRKGAAERRHLAARILRARAPKSAPGPGLSYR